MSDASTGKRRLWRWIQRCAAGLVVLVLAVIGVFYVLARSARSEWQRMEADLRARGEPLTFAEIAAARPAIADADNGAQTIERALDLLGPALPRYEEGVLVVDSQCRADFFRNEPLECIEATRPYVATRRAALAELAALRGYETAQFDFDYSTTVSGGFSVPEEFAGRLRQLSKVAGADAILRIVDGDAAGAVEVIRVQLLLGEAAAAEANIGTHVMSVAIDELASRAAEALLATRELTTDELTGLRQVWQDHASDRSIRGAILGERASFILMTDRDALIAGAAALAQQDPASTTNLPSLNPIDWLPFKDDLLIYRSRLRGVGALSELVKTEGELPKTLRAARAQQALFRDGIESELWISILFPSITRAIELQGRRLATLRCVEVALAAEQFRLEGGAFPASLDELVPNYLEAVPKDPFEGAPLRYAGNGDGVVIYSIAENQRDDGGRVASEEKQKSADVGIRLRRPELRKIVVAPPAMVEPGE